MERGFLGVPWVIWGGLALAVAAVFVVFVPYREDLTQINGPAFVILRWFHSLTWVLLAASFFMRATGTQPLADWANPVAALGGICYAVFIVTFITRL